MLNEVYFAFSLEVPAVEEEVEIIARNHRECMQLLARLGIMEDVDWAFVKILCITQQESVTPWQPSMN